VPVAVDEPVAVVVMVPSPVMLPGRKYCGGGMMSVVDHVPVAQEFIVTV
jgi:hypothetical protein